MEKFRHSSSLTRGQWGALHSPGSMWPVQEHGWANQVDVTGRAIWALTGQQQIKVKMVKPPAKVQIPRGEEQLEEQEEEEPRAGGREMGKGLALRFYTGSHAFPLLLVSAISSGPSSEEATDTRWDQSCTEG